jgi:Fe-S cluster biogenesis protein NfuA
MLADASSVPTHSLTRRVDEALDEIRPHLQMDGGDIEIVEITPDLVVRVRWKGNCESCNMSIMTMRAGVEQAIRNKVPEIHSVEAVNGFQP